MTLDESRSSRLVRAFLPLVVGATISALVGCSSGEQVSATSDVSELGACEPGTDYDHAPLIAVLDQVKVWHEVSSWEVVSGPADPPVDLTVVAVINSSSTQAPADSANSATSAPTDASASESDPPGSADVVDGNAPGSGTDDRVEFRAHETLSNDISAALRLGATVLAGDDGDGLVVVAAAEQEDQVAFLGLCAREGLTAPFQAAADAAGTKPTDLLESVRSIGADTALATPDDPEPVPADGAPPFVKLNPEDIGDEQYASYISVNLSISVPTAWTSEDEVLCTSTPDGWNDCYPLRSFVDGVQNQPIVLSPGKPQLTVWLLDATADLERPVARLGTLRLAELDRLAEQDRNSAPGSLVISVADDSRVSAALSSSGDEQQMVVADQSAELVREG
jgi:hypothetical protein